MVYPMAAISIPESYCSAKMGSRGDDHHHHGYISLYRIQESNERYLRKVREKELVPQMDQRTQIALGSESEWKRERV